MKITRIPVEIKKKKTQMLISNLVLKIKKIFSLWCISTTSSLIIFFLTQMKNYKAVVLKYGPFCPAPLGCIWQCLETHYWGREKLLVSIGQRPGMLLNGLQSSPQDTIS